MVAQWSSYQGSANRKKKEGEYKAKTWTSGNSLTSGAIVTAGGDPTTEPVISEGCVLFLKAQPYQIKENYRRTQAKS